MISPITWAFSAVGLLLAAQDDVGLLPPLPPIVEAQNAPNDRFMDLIESKIRLPEGAKPLASYRRLYTVTAGSAGKPLHIRAIFTTFADRPGRQWVRVEQMPMTFDGGCGVIRIEYDVPTDTIATVNCNGFG